jgi:virulence factor Mce-like protein
MAKRTRFDPVPGQAKPHPFRNGIIGLLIVAYVAISGFSQHLLFFPRGGTIVQAAFTNAKDVKNGTEVRVHGVEVGTVASVKQATDGKSAIVSLRINNIGALHLRQDASAQIWWRTLLGFNMYIEVDPGSPSAPPLNPLFISTAHTQAQVELDNVLQAFGPAQRTGIQTFFKTFDQAFSNDAAVGSAINALGPAMTHIAPGISALRGTQPGDLTRLLQQGNRLVTVLKKNDNSLAGLINNGAVALGVTAARSADLGATVDQAPATETQTQATMVRLRTTLNKLDPLSTNLQPGARALAPAAEAAIPTLREAVPLLDAARPTFRDLTPAISSLQSASQTGVPLLNGFYPTIVRTRDDIIPKILNTVDENAKLPTFQLIGPFFADVSSAAGQFDAYGHEIRFQAGTGIHAFSTLPCQANFGTTIPGTTGLLNCQKLQSILNLALSGNTTTASTNSAQIARPVPTLLSGLGVVGKGVAGSSAGSGAAASGSGASAAVASVSSGLQKGVSDGGQLVANLISTITGGSR